MEGFVDEVTNELAAASGVAALLVDPVDESIREAEMDGLHGGRAVHLQRSCFAYAASIVSRKSH